MKQLVYKDKPRFCSVFPCSNEAVGICEHCKRDYCLKHSLQHEPTHYLKQLSYRDKYLDVVETHFDPHTATFEQK